VASAEARVYLDASALVKLVIREPESDALAAYLRWTPLTSSELVLAEVPRACRLSDDSDDTALRVRTLLGELDLIGVSPDLLEAASVAPERLPTLDAIHLVTALRIDPREFVAYDQRLLAAAETAGLRTASPH
jgi:uncharacterized protein